MTDSRFKPECPQCGGNNTTIVMTSDTAAGERVRRRHCVMCDHRFYTEQSQEKALESWQVAWPGNRAAVLREVRS